MTPETEMTFEDELDLTRTPEGKNLLQGWDTFVGERHQADVYWDPTDNRWETYAPARFSFTRTSIRRQDPAQMWSKYVTLGEVLAISRAIRASGGSAIWNPRDGYWYHFQLLATQPKPSVTPEWVARMNAQLAAIDGDNSLSPEEKHAARIAIIDSYT
jgi:hypothetical protein